MPTRLALQPTPDSAEAGCTENSELSVLIRSGKPAAQHKIYRQAQRDRTARRDGGAAGL